MLAALTVNSTADTNVRDAYLTLRETILITNLSLPIESLSSAERRLIQYVNPYIVRFNVPADDPNHLYYRDDGIAGHVTLDNVSTTAAAEDIDIPDIDPDWAHSWFSIRPTSALPDIDRPITIDGYSQNGSRENFNSFDTGLNTVLRVEVNGESAGPSSLIRIVNNAFVTVRGLAINRALFTNVEINGGSVQIEGNFIGTDVSGTQKFATVTSFGVSVRSAISGPQPLYSGSIIGGTTAAERNLISGNGCGIFLTDAGESPNYVMGNLIGTDRSGTRALGNALAGIKVEATGPQFIGGIEPGRRNLISGNAIGVHIANSNSTTIRGNFIGTDCTGVANVGNIAVGVLVVGYQNLILENTVAFNGASPLVMGPSYSNTPAGIRLMGNENSASQNSFFSNFGLSIDLGADGTTSNDPGDSDAGNNDLQNFPILQTAFTNGATTNIAGSLNSEPNKPYRIEFYSSTAGPDAPQGRTFLGYQEATTGANGDAHFVVNLPLAVAPGERITATATSVLSTNHNSLVNTSEFSPAIVVKSPTLRIHDRRVFEGHSGQTQVTTTVLLSEPVDLPVVVRVYTTDGTATAADGDYQPISDLLLTFEPGGPLVQSVTVLVNGDRTIEDNETFFFNLAGPQNATLFDPQGVCTITDDDGIPQIRISDVAMSEGDTGPQNATFTISLSSEPIVPVSVSLATDDGTATVADGDYQPIHDLVLTFEPGAPLTQTVTVLVNGDNRLEPHEDFRVYLYNPVNATIEDDDAICYVFNDETLNVSLGWATITEGNQGTKEAKFSVGLSVSPTSTVMVKVFTSDGTATVSDNDYQAIRDLPIIFEPDGPLTQTFTVLINGDTKVESNDNFYVWFSYSDVEILGAFGVGIILNDDLPIEPATTAKDLLVLGSDAAGEGRRTRVKVIDLKTQEVRKIFTPYGSDFRGGARVAVADLDRDGIAEIITAPGAGRAGLVKVFDLNGVEQDEYRISAYPSSYLGGVFVAVGDVDGDGWIDIVTTPGSGRAAEVKVWQNRVGVASAGADPMGNTPLKSFLAFGATFLGGATVAAGDLTGDGKAEIIVGNGEGMSPTVRVFDATTFTTTGLAPRLREIKPFDSDDRGGVFVATGNLRGTSNREIIIGNGTNGRGRVEQYDADGTRFKTITAYTDESKNAPVHVAAKEVDHDDEVLLEVVTAQGNGGNRRRKSWQPDATLIDDVLETDADFQDGYFVA